MRKAIIIDDEVYSRELIRIMIQEYCQGVKVVGEADSVNTGLHLIERLQPDLVFLDVELPGGDGFNVLEHFAHPIFEVVLISGHHPQLLRSFDFAALAYLSKPVVLQEFQELVQGLTGIPLDKKQVQLVQEMAESDKPERLILNTGKHYSSIEIDQIAYIEAQRAYSRIVLKNGGEHFATFPLGHYEKILSEVQFFRVHKSYLLNLTLVDRYEAGRAGNIYLKNDATLPLAARRKAAFVQRLKQLKTG